MNPERFDGYHLRNDFLWGAYLILMTHVVWYGADHELYQVLLGDGFYLYKCSFLLGLIGSVVIMIPPGVVAQRPASLALVSIFVVVALELTVLSPLLMDGYERNISPTDMNLGQSLDENVFDVLSGFRTTFVFLYVIYRVFSLGWLIYSLLLHVPMALREDSPRSFAFRASNLLLIVLSVTWVFSHWLMVPPVWSTILLVSLSQPILSRSAPDQASLTN
jgi:hypothetical protein